MMRCKKSLITMIVALVIFAILGSIPTQAAVDPISAIAWALGFFTQQPKAFHSADFSFEVYTSITPDDLTLIKKFYPGVQMKAGDKLYINPETIFSQFDGKGLLLKLLSERKWIVHFSVPQSRDTEVKSGKVVVYRGVEPKSEQEIQESEIVFQHDFSSNDFSFVLPTATNGMAYSCSAYVEKPTKTNGFGYFRYYSKPASEYAREFDSSKIVGTMIYGSQMEEQKADADQYRTEKLTLLGRQEPEEKSAMLNPVNIVVQDKHGEVFRGLLQGSLNLKVSSEGVRIFKGTGERDLSSNPASESGCFTINPGQENYVVIYPWRETITIVKKLPAARICQAEVFILAENGTQGSLQMFLNDSTTAIATSPVVISNWCMTRIKAKTNTPQQKIRFVLFVGGQKFEKIWYAGVSNQIVFNCLPGSFYSHIYSQHRVAPIVAEKFSQLEDVRQWLCSVIGKKIYFYIGKNLLQLNENYVEQLWSEMIQLNNLTYVILGPSAKPIWDNGSQITPITSTIGMSDSTYEPKRNGYRVQTSGYFRVAVPKNRYGPVLGVDMDCANIYLVIISTPSYQPRPPICFRIPKLPEVPEINLPEFSFFIGKSSGQINSSVITPSSVSPLVATPSTKINITTGDVNASATGGAGGSSSSSSSSSSSATANPTSINNNTNININPIDINNTQNQTNIQQTQINNTNNNP